MTSNSACSCAFYRKNQLERMNLNSLGVRLQIMELWRSWLSKVVIEWDCDWEIEIIERERRGREREGREKKL